MIKILFELAVIFVIAYVLFGKMDGIDTYDYIGRHGLSQAVSRVWCGPSLCNGHNHE